MSIIINTRAEKFISNFIGKHINSPEQRLIQGVTALAMQPFIDYNNKLLKIQVKTAYKSSSQDVWTFNTRSTSKNYSEVINHNYIGLIDYFAVVNTDKNKIVFIDVNEASVGSMRIYYGDSPKPNQNWYKRYLWF